MTNAMVGTDDIIKLQTDLCMMYMLTLPFKQVLRRLNMITVELLSTLIIVINGKVNRAIERKELPWLDEKVELEGSVKLAFIDEVAAKIADIFTP